MSLAKGSFRKLLSLLLIQLCTSIDILYTNQSITDNPLLVSKNNIFVLGFFSPGSSGYVYLGIWYKNVPKQTVVWVANRDIPIKNASGILSMKADGNLVVSSDKSRNFPIWSTNLPMTSPHTVVRLLDSGNLVVLQQDTAKVIWQSFDHPTNTLLPHMKLGLDLKSGLNRIMTSWRSLDDPGTGEWSYRLEPRGSPQLFLYKGKIKWWRAGNWNGIRWSGVPEMSRNFVFNVNLVNNQDEISVVFNIVNAPSSSRFVLDESGALHLWMWRERDQKWVGLWSANEDQCNHYGHCGAYSKCDPYDPNTSECKCLPGFELKSSNCLRKNRVPMCHNGEGFIKVPNAKVPDTCFAHVEENKTLEACRETCMKNCSCKAYASADVRGRGCITWHGPLKDTRVFTDGGQDLYIRVDALELAEYEKKAGSLLSKSGNWSKILIILAIVTATVVLSFIVAFLYWMVKVRTKGNSRKRQKEIEDSLIIRDVTFFEVSTIVAATNNFSEANEIGRGGFGFVYKGRLDDGLEIAVKRLSKFSGQGIEELKNEVELIAKLQHKNLVRLLGCCIQEEERMLVYEYLPDGSLDSFIFDKTKNILLDWTMRFEIIVGIARGILYLHQDSRWKVIHRDIKASNILLDVKLNPKISDFGIARLVGEDQLHAETKRVVGTYGYMSPEYAMGGLYSTKSDVYSFGVLMLEIISGQRNYDYHDETSSMTLIGQVWELWKSGEALDIVDSSLGEAYPAHEVLKCIQIGLLCVQESATDRPTMLAILFMLCNETDIPSPNKPSYILKYSHKRGSSRAETPCTNELTMSIILGR